MKKKILGLSGSINTKATSWSLLRYIAKTFESTIDLTIYDQMAHLPHFNPTLEAHLPTEVKELRKLIAEADGVLFSTPEYVFSLPGSLKNTIEWNVSTTLFSGKPVAMIIAAASGEKAFESLALIMTTIEAILPDSSKLLIQGAKGKIQENDQIEDQSLAEQIHSLIDSLLQSADNPNKTPTKYL